MSLFRKWAARRKLLHEQETEEAVFERLIEAATEAISDGNRFSAPQGLFRDSSRIQAFVVRLSQLIGENIRADSAYGRIFFYSDDQADGLALTIVGEEK